MSLGDELAQIAVGGGNNPDIGFNGRYTAHGGVFALLEYTQQAGLRFERHVADLVEEQGSALGLFEAARHAGGRPGEGPLLVTEEFGFDEFAAQLPPC